MLYIYLTADVSPGWPMWPHYSFHLQAPGGSCLIRLDNAPHYPDVHTFPNHMHVGPSEAVQPLDDSSQRNIFELLHRMISQHRERAAGTNL
ncbi:MAG TPA: DUF6516 family protein [Chloroflexota bacterium]|nr:DUF6516 family protein [Chloroflexota bacterium]